MLSFSQRFWRLAPLVPLCLVLWLTAAAMPAHATDFPVTVTDLANRRVTINHPPERLFLDNPRHLMALAALLPDPVLRMSGWRGGLDGFDARAQDHLEAAWPALESLPVLGGQGSTPPAEALIALRPDLVIVDTARYAQMAQSPLLNQLAALDIPVLVIDFKQHPLAHTSPSLALLGRALGAEPRAHNLVDTLEQHEQAVTRCVAKATHQPRVLIDIAPGLKTDCCRSNFDSGLADLVARAGGNNMAAGLSPGRENLINPETILAHEPEVIIATAAQWPGGQSIRAGFDVTPEQTRHDMDRIVAQRPGWNELNAVRQGRFHALWHGHHQGPFGVVALEAIARWLHPQQCAALAPERTMTSLYEHFMPIPAEGTFQATRPADRTASSS